MPRRYAYLFFVKFQRELGALQAQELADFHKAKLANNAHLKEEEKTMIEPVGLDDRADSSELLPGYMRKLTGGYEYRTFWFEIFGCGCS